MIAYEFQNRSFPCSPLVSTKEVMSSSLKLQPLTLIFVLRRCWGSFLVRDLKDPSSNLLDPRFRFSLNRMGKHYKVLVSFSTPLEVILFFCRTRVRSFSRGQTVALTVE
jgi:hypothetical protein